MLLFTQEVSTPGVWRWKLGRCVHASLVDWKASQLSVVCNSATLNQISLSSSSCFFFLSFFLFFIWWPTGEKQTKFELFYQSLLKEKKKKKILKWKLPLHRNVVVCLFGWGLTPKWVRNPTGGNVVVLLHLIIIILDFEHNNNNLVDVKKLSFSYSFYMAWVVFSSSFRHGHKALVSTATLAVLTNWPVSRR